VLLLVVVSAVLLGFAPAPLPKPTRHVPPGIQGEWVVVSWTNELGRDLTILEARRGTTVRIADSRLLAYDGEVIRGWRLTLDANSVDFLVGADRSPVLLGIYKREGDMLTICYRGPREGRPTEFHDKRQWMLVLRRKRP